MYSPLKFNIILEVLASPIRQENKIKGRQVRKIETKYLIFRQHYSLNRKSPNKLLVKLVNLVRLQDTRSMYKNQLNFHIQTEFDSQLKPH